MSNDATLAPARKASLAQRTSTPQPAPSSGAPRIKFDTEAIDIITSRTEEIQALASCSTCLTAALLDSDSFGGYLLTDSALPLLSEVIRRLAEETAAAGGRLWEQYREALSAANGTEYHA